METIDYEDDFPMSPVSYAGDGIIYTTGHRPTAPAQGGVLTLSERVDREFAEIKRRLDALEAFVRLTCD